MKGCLFNAGFMLLMVIWVPLHLLFLLLVAVVSAFMVFFHTIIHFGRSD